MKTGGCVFLYSEFSVEVDKNRLYIFCTYLEQRESIEEGGVSWAELTSILPALPLLCFFARRTSKEHQLSFLPFFASLPPRSPTLPGLSASRGSNRLLKELQDHLLEEYSAVQSIQRRLWFSYLLEEKTKPKARWMEPRQRTLPWLKER